MVLDLRSSAIVGVSLIPVKREQKSAPCGMTRKEACLSNLLSSLNLRNIFVVVVLFRSCCPELMVL